MAKRRLRKRERDFLRTAVPGDEVEAHTESEDLNRNGTDKKSTHETRPFRHACSQQPQNSESNFRTIHDDCMISEVVGVRKTS